MKKIPLLFAIALALPLFAEDLLSEQPVQQQDSLLSKSLSADSVLLDSIDQAIEAMADTITDSPFFPQSPDSALTDLDYRLLEWSIGWLDTAQCVVSPDTTTLPDSVYKARLQALPCVIELPYNSIVRAFILRYVKRNPKQVARLKRMSEYYFPIFEEALCRHNLPYELALLPVIESALNPSAHSPAGAA